jgi:hypothetical protein
VAQLTNLAQYRQKVIDAARLELLAAAGDAVATLVAIRDDPNVPDAVRLKASTEILDRAGLHRGTELTISAPAQPAISPAEIIRGRLERLAAVSTSSQSDDANVVHEPETSGEAS